MSFMFNPFPYDDYSAVNTPVWSGSDTAPVIKGNMAAASFISEKIIAEIKNKKKIIAGFDGYATAGFDELVTLVSRHLFQAGIKKIVRVPVSGAYKDSDILEKQFEECLPTNTEEDPPLLYGRLYRGTEEIFFDEDRLQNLIQGLQTAEDGSVILVYGNFAGTKKLRTYFDFLAYIDVIPKNAVLRLKFGEAWNIGSARTGTYRELMRRSYYVDFEASLGLRAELLKSNEIDWYIPGNDTGNLLLLEWEIFKNACNALVKQPLRCKPVYNEGVWGGFYTMYIRNLPKTMRNCAWVFDLIPSEVSLVIKISGTLVDIPFYTFIKMEGVRLLGQQSVAQFGEYFPVRFNYDDTMHSSGNMSIQVHSGEKYNQETFNEIGRQDESYYIVAAGLHSKTYCGFKDNADGKEFISLIKRSEQTGEQIPYDDYVNSIETVPGMQFMLPAGTIHASGRNQLVLEIGSLTVGSYTFKLYDYLRKDIDGIPRPIHSFHGERVLDYTRNNSWVRKNIFVPPVEKITGDGWAEFILGEHDLIYFSLRRIEFIKEAKQNTEGKFHVLALVDGESVRVIAETDDRFSYTMHYLDIIVVPAAVGAYRLENLGNQPVAIHKTLLR